MQNIEVYKVIEQKRLYNTQYGQKYDFVIVINNFFTKKTVKLRKTREEYLKIFRYKKKYLK